MTLENNCKSCNELTKVERHYYCEYHQTEIFTPENAGCKEGYKDKYKAFENEFTNLLRELGVTR